jgi:hypothetical protein
MFRRALSQDIVEKDPATGLGAYDRGKPRDRILTIEEIETVWKWLGSDPLSLEASDIVKLQLLIGARCGEAAGFAPRRSIGKSGSGRCLPPVRRMGVCASADCGCRA